VPRGKVKRRQTVEAVKPFAWHGIQMEVPVEWDLGQLEGRFDKGFARLDDPNAARLELRWMMAPKRFRIDATLDRYFGAMTKTVQKGGGKLTLKTRGGIGPDRPGLMTRGFRWRVTNTAQPHANREAIGCIACNPETGQVAVVQALVRAGRGGDEAVARRTLASLSIGEVTDGMRTWAVYDFACGVLPEFGLWEHHLQSGAFHMGFESRRGRIDIRRWALAELLLDKHGGDLEAWWRAGLKRAQRRFRDEKTAVELSGHEATRLERSRRSLLGRRRDHAVFLWHCPASNQLFHVQVRPRRQKHWDALADDGWRVACHGSGEE